MTIKPIRTVISDRERKLIIDKDTKFALLVIKVPILGLLYCALIISVMILSLWAQEHPILTAAIFVIAPSLISSSIWLISSAIRIVVIAEKTLAIAVPKKLNWYQELFSVLS